MFHLLVGIPIVLAPLSCVPTHFPTLGRPAPGCRGLTTDSIMALARAIFDQSLGGNPVLLPIGAAGIAILYVVAGLAHDQPLPPPMVGSPIIAALCVALLLVTRPVTIPPWADDAAGRAAHPSATIACDRRTTSLVDVPSRSRLSLPSPHDAVNASSWRVTHVASISRPRVPAAIRSRNAASPMSRSAVALSDFHRHQELASLGAGGP